MSKFCHNCGKSLNDSDRFCDGCGAAQEVIPASQTMETQAPVAATPKAPNFNVNKIVDKAKELLAKAKELLLKAKPIAERVIDRCKNDKKYMYTCAGIAGGVLVVLVLLIVLLSSGSGYTKPIDTLIDATFKGKFEKITELAPEEYWEYLEEKYGVDIDDIIDEAEEGLDEPWRLWKRNMVTISA